MKEKRGILGGEKDNMVKSQPKKGYNDCSLCIYSKNLSSFLGYSPYDYIPGCLKKVLWFYIVQNPKKCNNFKQKGGYRI